VIVRAVTSQCELPLTLGLLLVNWTSHETVAVDVTRTVVFVVLRVAGEAAFVSVNVSADRRTVPLHVPPAKRVNERVPLSADPPVDVTVAESFGSQFCADVVVDVSDTLKHSLLPVPNSTNFVAGATGL
jgi:hypothetical protein